MSLIIYQRYRLVKLMPRVMFKSTDQELDALTREVANWSIEYGYNSFLYQAFEQGSDFPRSNHLYPSREVEAVIPLWFLPQECDEAHVQRDARRLFGLP